MMKNNHHFNGGLLYSNKNKYTEASIYLWKYYLYIENKTKLCMFEKPHFKILRI